MAGAATASPGSLSGGWVAVSMLGVLRAYRRRHEGGSVRGDNRCGSAPVARSGHAAPGHPGGRRKESATPGGRRPMPGPAGQAPEPEQTRQRRPVCELCHCLNKALSKHVDCGGTAFRGLTALARPRALPPPDRFAFECARWRFAQQASRLCLIRGCNLARGTCGVEGCRTNVQKLLRERSFGPTSTNLGQAWSMFRRCWPVLVKSWPELARVCHSWPNVGRCWARCWSIATTVGGFGPVLGRCWTKSVKAYQHRSVSVKLRLMLVKVGQLLVESGQTRKRKKWLADITEG